MLHFIPFFCMGGGAWSECGSEEPQGGGGGICFWPFLNPIKPPPLVTEILDEWDPMLSGDLTDRRSAPSGDLADHTCLDIDLELHWSLPSTGEITL